MAKTLGQVLRERRIRLGETQEAAAYRIGCDIATLGRWERHRARVKSCREALRAYLDCDRRSFEELLLAQAEAVERRRRPRAMPHSGDGSEPPAERFPRTNGVAAPSGGEGSSSATRALRRVWNSREMLLARRRVCELARRGPVGTGGPQAELLGFFEELHHCLERGEISRHCAWLVFGRFVDLYHAVLEEAVRTYRREFEDDSRHAGFLLLKRELDAHARGIGARVPGLRHLPKLLAEELEQTELLLAPGEPAGARQGPRPP